MREYTDEWLLHPCGLRAPKETSPEFPIFPLNQIGQSAIFNLFSRAHSTRETGGLGHVGVRVTQTDPAYLRHMQRGPHARSSCRRWLRLQRSPRSPHRLPLLS